MYNMLPYPMGGNTDVTIVSLAVQRSESVRTTIPKHIAKKLGLGVGARVVWDLDKVDGEWIVVVRRAARP